MAKRDFSYYFIRLSFLDGEMKTKKAEGWDTAEILPKYLKEILKGVYFTKMTAAERIKLKKLQDELETKYGK